MPLTGWLRDVQIGSHTYPPTALIMLRGTQAALFGAGILLRWAVDALGPDPAARLRGTLTTSAATAISSIGSTDDAAAAVLSLHLNQSPHRSGCLRVGDVTDDGSAIAAHNHGPAQLHHGWILSPDQWREVSCETGILLPESARPILRAHLAHRGLLGATDADPLFANPLDPQQPTGPQALRNAAARAGGRANLAPNWLHRDPCRYGADVGLHGRAQGWLIERGLTLHQLNPTVAARSPRWRSTWNTGAWDTGTWGAGEP